jgi:4-hydroxy-tetrahydrodipicolinate synthase
MSLSAILRGTGVALVTPFNGRSEVDYPALERLIQNVISEGVDYLVTMGTTGETATLTQEEKYTIIKFTYDIVADRLPVVVGIGGNHTTEVIYEILSTPLEGAVAILSASPNYNKPSQEGIFQHYKAIAEASALPVLLYNVPLRTGSNLTAETTLRLAEIPNIAGIKEASGNMVQCMHILHHRPADFLVVSGDDHLTLPLIACGMEGVISVAANCFPRAWSDMTRFALRGDFENARKLHYQCLEGNDLLFAENNPAGVKAFLAEMGLIENVLRLPLVPLSAPVHERVKAYLANT